MFIFNPECYIRAKIRWTISVCLSPVKKQEGFYRSRMNVL
ncbi:hypothetical protein ENTCAN_07333 [Enterobacter cancerogenus ATCC 35316]|nr:hypothetical protein ENTCAN_07333 [Enterobacter cancerogenus ATCC 35316]